MTLVTGWSVVVGSLCCEVILLYSPWFLQGAEIAASCGWVTGFASVVHKNLVCLLCRICATWVLFSHHRPSPRCPAPPHVPGKALTGRRVERGCFPRTAQALGCTGRRTRASLIRHLVLNSFLLQRGASGLVGSLGGPAGGWQGPPAVMMADGPWTLAPKLHSPSAGKWLCFSSTALLSPGAGG